jgi:hypothetical protein
MGNRLRSNCLRSTALGFGLFVATPVFAWERQKDSDRGNENVLVVVDANNKLVGNFGGVQSIGTSGGAILRNVNGVWVGLSYSVNGLTISSTQVVTYAFSSSNCTGNRYLNAESLPVTGIIVQSTNNTNTLYFPGSPVKQLVLGSYLNYLNQCVQTSGSLMAGPAQSVSIDTYKAPFSIKSLSQLRSENCGSDSVCPE